MGIETPDRNIVNQHEWRIIGMSRSGNHAIIGWLLEGLTGRYCFLNCAEPRDNPFSSARPMAQGVEFLVNYRGFDLDREREGLLSKKDFLVYSHEDCFLGLMRHGSWEESHDEWIGPSASRRDVLILRDPFNLFASRMKLRNSLVSTRVAIRIWKQHAREFLGESRRLPNPSTIISYNSWVQDACYRRQLTIELGIKPNSRRFERVPSTAGGSSFDGLQYQQNASQMKVFDRWRRLIDYENYRKLFDRELIELAEKVFGPLPASEALRSYTRRPNAAESLTVALGGAATTCG